MSWDVDEFRRGIQFLENRFRTSLERVEGRVDTSRLTRKLDEAAAKDYLYRLWGEGEYTAVGIDGSMDHSVALDIITMFIAVATAEARFTVSRDGLRVSLDESDISARESIYKVVPYSLEDSVEASGFGSALEERSVKGTIESIPNAVMTLGEFYIARKSLEREDVKIVFLDRPIASTYGPYSRNLRERLDRDWDWVFIDEDVMGGEAIQPIDIYLTLHIGPRPGFLGLQYIPGQKLAYVVDRMLSLADEDGMVDLRELGRVIPTSPGIDKLLKRLERNLGKELFNMLVEEVMHNRLVLASGVKDYWTRVSRVCDEFLGELFGGGEVEHPLYVKGRPVTVADLSLIGIVEIYRLAEIVRETDKLVIGMGKDTAVTDIIRSVAPYLGGLREAEQLTRIARTDRNLFTLISASQPEDLPIPWRSVGYDNAFSALVYRTSLEAPRGGMPPPRLLIRQYFQLREWVKGGVRMRSPIFFFDRFYLPHEPDNQFVKRIEIIFRKRRPTKERREAVDIYIEDGEGGVNPLDNTILYIISRFDKPLPLEAAGHNYLLFLADKEVKRMIRVIRDRVSRLMEGRIYSIMRESKTFMLPWRFREFRARVEHRRR